LLLPSEVEILFWGSWGRLLGKPTDLGNDAQFVVFVPHRATEDYVEQFLFCCPLPKNTTRKEMFNRLSPQPWASTKIFPEGAKPTFRLSFLGC